MSSMGANYAQLHVMQKKQKEKMMMKKRLEKEREGGVDGGEGVGVSSAAAGKSDTRIYPVKSSPSATYEEVEGKIESVRRS
ncbi:unnamed protein product [Eruca vesicaria subsp. sativa]|uniref:Uncharacterized protein n=1 Tax=Eruca vesicaria subsp. sativa TaxID=29727 RepID=A0ABC8J1X1_ERUVS|nr:unnamed protein product [Eruca vesicaria subsp. sativa]